MKNWIARSLALGLACFPAAAQSEDPIADIQPVVERLIQKSRGAALVPRMIQDLRQEQNYAVRIRIIRVLGRFAASSPQAVPALAERLQQEQHGDVRGAICRTLGELGPAAGEAVGVTFRAFVMDPSGGVRDACLEASKRIGLGPQALEVVAELVRNLARSDNYRVRADTCRAAGLLGPLAGRVVPDLIRAAAADPSSSARESCEQAAADMMAAGFDPRRDMPREESARLVSELGEFIENDSKPYALRAKACGWLGRLGPGAGSAAPGIFSTLVRLGHRDSELGSSCAEALEKIHQGPGG